MATKESTEEKPADSERRTRGARSRRRPVGNGKKAEDNETPAEDKSKPRRVRSEVKSLPVPVELVGKEATGKIFDIIKRFQAGYGFIFIDTENSSPKEKPKIYFNLKDFDETEFAARRGYLVKFTILKDEKDRFYATTIKLTEEGKAGAIQREARIAATRAEDEAEGKITEAKPRRARNPPNESVVNLQVSCEGKKEVHTIAAKQYQSIGGLKYAAAELFGVPMTYTIFCQKSAENPNGVKLNKVILKGMQDGDSVFMAPGEEEVKA